MVLRKPSLVGWIKWRKRAQAVWGNKLLLHEVQYHRLPMWVQDSIAQRAGQQLIRSQAVVVPMWAVDEIVEIAAILIPEAFIEVASAQISLLFISLRGMVNAPALIEDVRPLVHERERIVPQGADLNRFASARCDRLSLDERIHPGQRAFG